MSEERVVSIRSVKSNGGPRKSKACDRQPTGDWRDAVLYSREGLIEPTVANVITVLVNDPSWAGIFVWNEFGQVIGTARVPPWDPDDAPTSAAAGEWSDSDTIRAQACKLDPSLHWRLRCWLADKPELRELWAIKEAINRIYRIHGHARANRALTLLTDAMARSNLPEVRTLRSTLVRWRK